MIRGLWLLVINIPDERINRAEYDHMHSWFTTEGEAQQVKRALDDQLGGDDGHEIIGPPFDPICPRCGATPR